MCLKIVELDQKGIKFKENELNAPSPAVSACRAMGQGIERT